MYRGHKLWGAYKAHRWNAKKRGILFLLTFGQWLKIWEKSGHIHERGCRKGQYVMARFGDEGPYKVGNVKVITVEANISEALPAREYLVSEETRVKISQALLGNKRALGHKHSADTRTKISIKVRSNHARYWLGRKLSEETKKKIRTSSLGRKHSEESKEKMRASRHRYLESIGVCL